VDFLKINNCYMLFLLLLLLIYIKERLKGEVLACLQKLKQGLSDANKSKSLDYTEHGLEIYAR
jgi:hypothetical protein